MRYVRVAAGVLSCLVVLMSASACGKEKEEVLEPQQTAAVTEAALTSETEETTEPEETEETTDSEETTEDTSEETGETGETGDAQTIHFILNTDSNCVHTKDTCSAVKEMLPEHKSTIDISANDISNYTNVYWACGICAKKYSDMLPKFDTSVNAETTTASTVDGGVTMLPIDGQPVTTLPAENNTPEQPIETIPSVPVQPVGDEVTFQFNGNVLRVGDNASGFTSAVPANSQESAQSCYGKGENINYYYDEFTIYVWNEDGNYMVYGIDIEGPGVATQKGITIGSTVDDMIAAYGGEYQEEGMDYVYTYGDNCSLRFTVDNNEVLYISYNMDLDQ